MDVRGELVDAAYRLDLAETAQLQLVVEVMQRRFEPKRRVQAFTVRLADGKASPRATVVDGDDLLPLLEFSFSAPDTDAIYLSPPALRSTSTFIGPDFRPELAHHGITEFVGLNCPTQTGGLLVVGAIHDEPMPVTAAQHAFWLPVAEHLAAGARLREHVTPEADAVFRVDRGDVVTEHLTTEAAATSARAKLRRAVVQRERQRARSRATREELWPAVIDGRWTLIDRFDENGRRYLLAVQNPAGPQVQMLSPRERSVIAAMRRGEANKAIAIELDVSEATISRIANSALAKLGLGISDLLAASSVAPTILELGRVRLGLVTLPGMFPGMKDLTDAERAVVGGILRGSRTASIARERGVAERTVTNQLASAFQKLGVRSRRELILAVCRPAST